MRDCTESRKRGKPHSLLGEILIIPDLVVTDDNIFEQATELAATIAEIEKANDLTRKCWAVSWTSCPRRPGACCC